MGEFVTYAIAGGLALVGRLLYLPKEWLEDSQQCKPAAILGQVQFSTKPELARQMLQTAPEVQLPFKWVTGDSI